MQGISVLVVLELDRIFVVDADVLAIYLFADLVLRVELLGSLSEELSVIVGRLLVVILKIDHHALEYPLQLPFSSCLEYSEHP